MRFQDDEAPLRLSKQLKNKINRHIRKHKGIYTSRSHFIRCAIIKALRDGGAEKEAKNEKRSN
jgi:Arc/MetJ-type ribon-helix-helix transcriptional regulator